MTGIVIVEQTTWAKSVQELVTIRQEVFMGEQQCPEEEEFDGLDGAAVHFIAKDKRGEPIGCCRIVNGDKLERMAVMKSVRGEGVGKKLMVKSLEYLKTLNCEVVYLHAQTHAVSFYESFGFLSYGDMFIEAGIPHYIMKLNLN